METAALNRYAIPPVLLFALALPVWSADYFVAPNGADGNAGTLARPFRTIQRAADMMKPGDTCYVRGGTYRESITLKRGGQSGAPIRFRACSGEIPVLDGTEPITGRWARHKGSIYKTHTQRKFEQLFVNRRMMLEARWPNTTFDKLLTREGWATTGPKSVYQKLHDPKLGKTGIDWTGATAVLNVAHQFYTWSRPVLNYKKGSDTFEYHIKMNPFHVKGRHWWSDDFYYLMGKLEALDAPTEWFLAEDGTLYLWPPDGVHLNEARVEVKVRDYGFFGKGLKHVEISGFHFFACTFAFENCQWCVVEHCNLLFPSFVRGVPDADEPRHSSAGTHVTGDDNVVRSCSLAYCANYGIRVRGRRNRVENCLIHDVNWSGTLVYTGIALAGDRRALRSANAASHNTVYNVGNAIITTGGNRYGVVEYNHVHHGGLICADVSLIYTSMPYAMGNEIRYNWVHDSLSPNNSLGIRGDDKTRGMRVHHNVVWNVHDVGIVVKGGLNRIYNNTCFDNGACDILFMSGREPDKWWQKWVKAYEHQNENSLLTNNCAPVVASTRRRRQPGLPGDHSNNYTGGAPRLVNPDGLDFRPRADSPLVDAGRVVEGVTAPFKGKAPDIGAYEFHGERWLPGHHNGVWVTRDAAGRLQAALWMPILEPLRVAVSLDGRPLPPQTFTPSNWMRPQPLSTVAGGALRFETRDWGTARVADTRAVTPLAGARVAFEQPDLASAKGWKPRYHYERSYQLETLIKPVFRAFKTTRPVTIDGRLSKSEWIGWAPERALPLISLEAKPGEAYPAAGGGYVLFDGANLYVGVRIRRRSGAGPKPADGQWNKDDGVEVDFCTVIGKKPGPAFVLHGFPSGKFESVTTGGAPSADAQRLGSAVQYAARVGSTEWTAEFCIPFAAMAPHGGEWKYLRFNLGARCNDAPRGPWFALQNTKGPNYDLDRAALLVLRPAALARAGNMLKNGSFESADLSAWRLTSNSREPIPKDAARRVREGRDAGWCVKLQCQNPALMKRRVFKWMQPLPPELAPGRYSLSFDVRVQGLTPRGPMGSFNAYMHVKRGGKSRANLGQQDGLIDQSNLPWTRKEIIVTTNKGDVLSMVSLQLHHATGTVWIDNVSLVRCQDSPQ